MRGRPRATLHDLGPRAHRDRLQRVAIGADALHRQQAHVTVLGLDGHRQDVRGIAQAFQRRQPHAGVRRLAGHGRQEPAVRQAIERGARHRLQLGRPGHDHHVARFRDAVQGLAGHGLVGRILREGDDEIARHAPHRLVLLAPGDRRERRRIGELGDGGAPDAGVFVFTGYLRQQILVVVGHRVHGGDANGWIGVLPAWL